MNILHKNTIEGHPAFSDKLYSLVDRLKKCCEWKYPERTWTLDFYYECAFQWMDKIDELEKKVIELEANMPKPEPPAFDERLCKMVAAGEMAIRHDPDNDTFNLNKLLHHIFGYGQASGGCRFYYKAGANYNKLVEMGPPVNKVWQYNWGCYDITNLPAHPVSDFFLPNAAENTEFELKFCEICFQMTNHKDGVCQKHQEAGQSVQAAGVHKAENFMQPVYTKQEILGIFTDFYVKMFGKLQEPKSDPDGKIINGVTIYGMLSLAITEHEEKNTDQK